jgi:hypothetical protein
MYAIKKTHHDRQVLLDRLEKKYIKKVQLQAFHRESELLKRSLTALRGRSARGSEDDIDQLSAEPVYRLRYS